ncbi:MAG: class I SAM-dependent methyltransferase [Gemmatimonadaceae bacterium]|nr:class I SAM-dependent methyltransferase [Burkholderiales bacterium]MBY0492524.1 class I SAM-dependent methyltransferase [Gemmatimonadaceae bacterium]
MQTTQTRPADTAPEATPQPDLKAIKARQQVTWASGDFGVVGTTLQIVGESLCEAVDLYSGEAVLDVAAGNGNASLAAARRFANVTSTDYVPELLEQGRKRAAGDRLPMEFQVADAEALPFTDETFDVVLSTFGVMFAPNQEQAAAEMLRVVKSGGRIGMANWTPEGFLGELFRTIAAFVPPPAGLKSPMGWGSEPRLVQLFGTRAADIRCERRYFMFRYRSAEHFIEIFRNFYGPTHKVFAALDADNQNALHKRLVELLARFNRAGTKSLVVPAEYLEVVITKR